MVCKKQESTVSLNKFTKIMRIICLIVTKICSNRDFLLTLGRKNV